MTQLRALKDRLGLWYKDLSPGRQLGVIVGTVVVVALVLGSLGGSDSEPGTSPAEPTAPRTTTYLDRYGGEQAVYTRIASMTDCAALQTQFDVAADNNDRAEPGTAEHKWTLGYMTAADDRMETVGCYD